MKERVCRARLLSFRVLAVSFRTLSAGLPVASFFSLLLALFASNASAVAPTEAGNVFHVADVRVRVERLLGESDEQVRARVQDILTRANRDLYTIGLFTEAVSIEIEDGSFDGSTLYDVLRNSLIEREDDTTGAQVLLTIVRSPRGDQNLGLAFTGSMCRSGMSPMVLVSAGSDLPSRNKSASTWAHEFAHTVGLGHDDVPCNGPRSLTAGGFPKLTIMATRATHDNCGFSAGQQVVASQRLAGSAGSCLRQAYRALPALEVSIPNSVEQPEGEAIDVPVQVKGAIDVTVSGLPEGGYYDAAAGIVHLPALQIGGDLRSKVAGSYSLLVEIVPMAGDTMRISVPVTVVRTDSVPTFDHGAAVTFAAPRGRVSASVTARDDGSVVLSCTKLPRGVKSRKVGDTIVFSGSLRRSKGSFWCTATDASGQVGAVSITFIKTRR